MRTVAYRQGSGRPTETARSNLNELVMLMEAAVALANVERWVQESVTSTARAKVGASVLPEAVRRAGKRDSYEVSIVDGFMRLGAVSFAAHGSEAVWERTFPTSGRGRGRPVSVDVCLFNDKRDEEARIEFGPYKLEKLKRDAKKLAVDLLGPDSAPVTGCVTNFVMLWRTRESPVVKSDHSWRDTCIGDAKKASTAKYAVKMEVTSEQDMFVAESKGKRKAQVALFSVLPPGNSDSSGEDLSESAVHLPL